MSMATRNSSSGVTPKGLGNKLKGQLYTGKVSKEGRAVVVKVELLSSGKGMSRAERPIIMVDQDAIVSVVGRLHDEGWLPAVGEHDQPGLSLLPADDGDPLPAGDAEFLQKHGGVSDNRMALFQSRLETSLMQSTAIHETETAAQVAIRLGKSRSRVLHRISEGAMYAFPSRGKGNERRIPTWQFDDGKVVPHLGEVLAALPEDFSPLEIRAFFMNARVDEPGIDEPVTVREWLLSGADPSPIVELAHAQGEVL
jgi:hypothetical protein